MIYIEKNHSLIIYQEFTNCKNANETIRKSQVFIHN